jgi:aminodeoxyfutalosine deaminase
MQYAKVKASKIFNGWSYLPDGSVIVIDKANNAIVDILPEENAGADIQFFEGTICPAFVNAHCHIELSHLKNKIPQHTGLVGFIEAIIKQRDEDAEIINQCIADAANELFESGTIAVGDICNTTHSLSCKQNSPMYWHSFVELSGFNPLLAEKKIEDGRNLKNEFKQIQKQATLTPHAPYSVSEQLFAAINNEREVIYSIHNQETAHENIFFQKKEGEFLNLYKNLGIEIDFFTATNKRSIETVLPLMSHAEKMLFVHNSFSTQEDIDFIQAKIVNPYYCICINANLFIENTTPPLELFMKNNCNIVIGTDSYASNTSLNMYSEIKSIQKHFPTIPTEQILQWTTINGAMALGIDDKYGSIEIGKQAAFARIKSEKASRLSF